MNINGWTRASAELKGLLCKFKRPNTVCLSETHLDGDEQIEVQGYKCYAKNHREKTRGSPKTFGGVCILVRNEIFTKYSVEVCSNDTEGLIALRFKHNLSEFESIIASTYLPPADSPYGREVEPFFNRLLMLIYECNEADNVVFCGDINARIGSRQDICLSSDVKGISTRQTVDVKVNSHGQAFLDFLNDACCCIANGRAGPAEFTCINSRGKSEVDFVFMPIDILENVVNLKIYSCAEIITKAGRSDLVCDGSKPPDHCLIQFELICSGVYTDNNCKTTEECVKKKGVPRKFKKDFMQ